ncbi:MAG: hypothetical protein R3350_05330, partial [Saprospiraceae bacterium]|nr:hypothetical protein [Saprospiraceae bacterium]
GDGHYQFTLTDSNGCSFVSDTISIESPPPLEVEVDALGQIACFGESTGFLELTTKGGVPPYSYSWTGVEADTEDIFDLAAGAYRLQIRDANDCPFSRNFQLSQPAPLEVAVDLKAGDICDGELNNRLSARVNGGIPPYSYSWSNGAGSAFQTGVPSGDYRLSVTDANLCFDRSGSVKVKEQETPLVLDTFFVRDISCHGAQDGSMTATISGGNTPYRFHFSNNFIRETNLGTIKVEGLSIDDDYRVTITDLNTGCFVVSPSLALSEPNPLFISRDSVREVSCGGSFNGSIFVSVSGGTPPYNYQWFEEDGSEIISGEQDLERVREGTYFAVVTDANGCTDTLPQTLLRASSQPLGLADSSLSIQHIACKGEQTGAIDLEITGGTPPYDFQWSNGAGTEDLSNIPAGTYTLTVTDANACRAILPPLTIEEPDALLTVSPRTSPVSCHGSSDGSIELVIRGGEPPYATEWLREGESIASDITELSGLPAGSYLLQVADQRNCRRQIPIDLPQPNPIEVDIELIEDPEAETFRLRAKASGGTPTYSFLWSTGDTTAGITVFDPGMYSLTLTDANGCEESAALTLTSTIDPSLVEQINLFPNPGLGEVNLQIELRESRPLQLRIADEQGRLVLERFMGRVIRSTETLRLHHLSAGDYWVQLWSEGKLIYSGKLVLMPR